MFGGAECRSTAVPATASAKPAAPPAIASSTASVNSCRISRARPAPNAARRPSSFARTVPRARCKLEIFTQAMSRTSVTADNSIKNAGRTGPTISS